MYISWRCCKRFYTENNTHVDDRAGEQRKCNESSHMRASKTNLICGLPIFCFPNIVFVIRIYNNSELTLFLCARSTESDTFQNFYKHREAKIKLFEDKTKSTCMEFFYLYQMLLQFNLILPIYTIIICDSTQFNYILCERKGDGKNQL